ncbi:MAG: hypothetical protein N2035_09675 [Chthoniobacterales bacterium]|nr:hypothetical protein [Chthoniobacterales bacterium]
MKKALLNNWNVKLVCLVVAAVLWFLIRENVGQSYERERQAGKGQWAPGQVVP